MKPTVITNANTSPSIDSSSNSQPANGINIPINREYTNPASGQHSSYNSPQFTEAAFGSPKMHPHSGRPYNQQQQQPTQHQQVPSHFQSFGFEPDIDMDMFPRSRLGRTVHHDPFHGFGGSHFAFPQFSSMARRRTAPNANDMSDDDFFNRLPSEFRQYMPEHFGRRAAGNSEQFTHNQPSNTEQLYQQGFVPTGNTPPSNEVRVPQSPSKRLCDAAIQTDEPDGRSEVDNCAPSSLHADNLNQHGLRNTMDMGIKSKANKDEVPGVRSQSAPPPEQQNLQYQQNHQANISETTKQCTPPPSGQPQHFSNLSAHHQQHHQQPQLHRQYFTPQQQAHPQQKQQTPPPQTPGGSYVRTIPIFVEGRSEPVINSNKDIPNQNSSDKGVSTSPSANINMPQQQQHRPSPLNTQDISDPHTTPISLGMPPQTPHTLDSINKIQDIQRDVLDLMAKVENFAGTRQDKEYVYLDEMLTRNLLKLDTIDTNGKESIRLARKEAIKCIQASITVLEAKAEENAKNVHSEVTRSEILKDQINSDTSINSLKNDASQSLKSNEPIPLPPPPGSDKELQNVGCDTTVENLSQQESDQLSTGELLAETK